MYLSLPTSGSDPSNSQKPRPAARQQHPETMANSSLSPSSDAPLDGSAIQSSSSSSCELSNSSLALIKWSPLLTPKPDPGDLSYLLPAWQSANCKISRGLPLDRSVVDSIILSHCLQVRKIHLPAHEPACTAKGVYSSLFIPCRPFLSFYPIRSCIRCLPRGQQQSWPIYRRSKARAA